VKCAECLCIQEQCRKVDLENCALCSKKDDGCCCINIHGKDRLVNRKFTKLTIFFNNVKNLYAVALGIEILCISFAELGENTGFYIFGYRTPLGITVGYAMGYSLAAFSTFATIVGRYNFGSNEKMCGCCSVLEQDGSKTFASNVITTFNNFLQGLRKMSQLYKQPNLKEILKTSLTILITAETACILTAETIDLIFYRHSLFLSIPLALLAGAFTVVAPQAYRLTKGSRQQKPKLTDTDEDGFVPFKRKKE